MWQQIVDSVRPLHGSRNQVEIDEALSRSPGTGKPQPKLPLTEISPQVIRQPTAAPYYPPVSDRKAQNHKGFAKPLDDKTVRKLRKGKLDIDAVIDLHGMAQLQAHRSLIDFVENQQRADARIVLVITGKGRSGQGILRDAVPRWLAEHPLREMVGGWRNSHLSHGGEGALYVRIKRSAPASGMGR
ncbi:MAG: Smr/MutS family protein [Rhizobiaceae bacterium]